MTRRQNNRLIIVEGLTGSGKSITAHYIARQLHRNGVRANWVHEGEAPHPIRGKVESSVEDYMTDTLMRWSTFVSHIESSGEVTVVEACFFNNLIESLLAHNVSRSRILEYGDQLEKIIMPLNPALVYLTSGDVSNALAKNFEVRGEGFLHFVIRYATSTPFAKRRRLAGYAGMLVFWQEFVAVTDELFDRYHIAKIAIDVSAGEWESYRCQVLDFLSIPLIPEGTIEAKEALRYVGIYKDEKSGREFAVQYDDDGLIINPLLNAKTRLIRHGQREFVAEGWHFGIKFELDGTGNVAQLGVGGRDVDYFKLVGTIAVKQRMQPDAG